MAKVCTSYKRYARLATATHDTKRGEDTRARLAVLSEMPEEWLHQVQTWSRLLRARRGDVEGSAPPHRNDEYLLYQLLVGTWPVELLVENPDSELLGVYAKRIKRAMVKSMREAKVRSSWAAPDTAYEEATLAFVSAALDTSGAGSFLANFIPFVSGVARLGARNTVTQTVLKLTVPGVPDLYQGTELWDFSMVDPDNRRVVDYSLRARLLEEVSAALARERRRAMTEYMESWQDARFKLAIVTTLLNYRREHEALFRDGEYLPLAAEGPGADQVCAFVRRSGDDMVAVAVARHPARWERQSPAPDTIIPLPEELRSFAWHDLLSGVDYTPAKQLPAAQLFSTMPAAVLTPG